MVDWFLTRCFRFLSTTLHVAVNVKAAVDLNTNGLEALHAHILGKLRLKPRKTITVSNAVGLEGEDLQTQCSHQGWRKREGEQARSSVTISALRNIVYEVIQTLKSYAIYMMNMVLHIFRHHLPNGRLW